GKEREDDFERRTQVLGERMRAEGRVDSLQRDLDNALGTIGESLPGAKKKAVGGLQEVRPELNELRKELTGLEAHQANESTVTSAQVKEAEQAVVGSKNNVVESKQLLDAAQRELDKAQDRFEGAASRAASVDLS